MKKLTKQNICNVVFNLSDIKNLCKNHNFRDKQVLIYLKEIQQLASRSQVILNNSLKKKIKY
jgi:virulence-associated protein VapD